MFKSIVCMLCPILVNKAAFLGPKAGSMLPWRRGRWGFFGSRTFSHSQSYILPMFPYPSGNLHMGHARVYVAADVLARYSRLKGKKVIFPIGWDSFGLPAENAARQHSLHPKSWTDSNIAEMKRQLQRLDVSFDWNRELKTSDSSYYRWTQWLFLQLYERGLAYKASAQVNWDPIDHTVLADEQVDGNGNSWRSGCKVERRQLSQWFFKITAYADKLLGQSNSDWPQQVLQVQQRWIGKSPDGTFKLRDWLVSRQRYWGTPIPIVHCNECGAVPLRHEDLPLELPADSFVTLGNHPTWKHTKCPKCGLNAERETDTLDTFVDSSFYYLRFLDPQNKSELISKEKIRPVDIYLGGLEHSTSHLLYSRFIWTFLMETFEVRKEEFPFKMLANQGMVCGKTFKCSKTGKYVDEKSSINTIECWEKMSKSKGNGISPNQLLDRYGADVTRLGILFKCPLVMDIKWNEADIQGQVRWLKRLDKLVLSNSIGSCSDELEKRMWMLVEKYEHNISPPKCAFNVCIAELMKFSNYLQQSPTDVKQTTGYNDACQTLLILLYPFAPSYATMKLKALFPDIDIEGMRFPLFQMTFKSLHCA